jgi:predicted transcriptional regulator
LNSVGDGPGLPELLFSLASDDRLTLLDEIDAKKQRLTPLAKVINATVQECSRHLQRLSDAGFVIKDAEGLYSTTSLGRAMIRLVPGMKFLLNNRDYFLTHDLRYIPEAFVERIGELSSGELVYHVSRTLELIKETISEGRRYVWLIADQPPIVSKVPGSAFVSKDMPVRLIGETIDPSVLSSIRSALRNSEVVLTKDIRVAMAINENQAGICFPDLRGRPDFSAGFASKDERFIGWCRDLFQYYWAQATK